MLLVIDLNAVALESKLENASMLSIKSNVHLVSLRHEENEKWIRFCSAYYVSATYFMTVGRCIDKMKNHGGQDKVRIFLRHPSESFFQIFQIKAYQRYEDYIKRRKFQVSDNNGYYDVALLWVSEI